MPRYLFDMREGDVLVPDEIGIEFDGLGTAEAEAVRALLELAHEAVPGATRRDIAVEVRDGDGQPVLRAALSFGVERLTR